MPYPLITDVLGSPTNNVLWCTTSIWEDSRKNAGGKNQIWYRCLNIMSLYKKPQFISIFIKSKLFLRWEGQTKDLNDKLEIGQRRQGWKEIDRELNKTDDKRQVYFWINIYVSKFVIDWMIDEYKW